MTTWGDKESFFTGVKFCEVRNCWSCCCCCCCSRRSCFCCSDRSEDLKDKRRRTITLNPQTTTATHRLISPNKHRLVVPIKSVSCLPWCKTQIQVDFFSGWFKDTLGTYGLTLLGSWKLCASAWGLSGGGWGRRAGSVGWLAFCTGDWITPFRPPSTPFIASWGLPARDAMSPPTTGREEPPAWLMVPKLSLRPRPRPFSKGWLKEAGLCWGGGVLWKERDELLRDGLPEWSSCNKDRKSAF